MELAGNSPLSYRFCVTESGIFLVSQYFPTTVVHDSLSRSSGDINRHSFCQLQWSCTDLHQHKKVGMESSHQFARSLSQPLPATLVPA